MNKVNVFPKTRFVENLILLAGYMKRTKPLKPTQTPKILQKTLRKTMKKMCFIKVSFWDDKEEERKQNSIGSVLGENIDIIKV